MNAKFFDINVHKRALSSYNEVPVRKGELGNELPVPEPQRAERDIALPAEAPPNPAERGNALPGRRWNIILVVMNLMFLAALLAVLCHMHMGNLNVCPTWDPAGTVPFRTWVREVQAWLNVTSQRSLPPQQAAAIQLSLRGVARNLAMTIPPGRDPEWSRHQRRRHRPRHVPAIYCGEQIRGARR